MVTINENRGLPGMFRRAFSKLGPLAPLLLFFAVTVSIFFLFRVILTGIYWDRILNESEFYKLFLIGLRMDTILLSYLLFIPATFLILLSKAINQRFRLVWLFYFVLLIDLFFFFETATIPFIEEFDLRPDALFIKYVDNFREVSATVWQTNKWFLLITVILLCLVHIMAWRLFSLVIKGYSPKKVQTRLMIFAIVIPLLVLGARSSFAPRPANISTAYFSEKNKLVNELTLNSSYSLFMAFLRQKNEKDPSAIYGNLPEHEIYSRVREKMGLHDTDFITTALPIFRKHRSPVTPSGPMNIVIILEESLGAEYVGHLGGLPLTPNLDSLSKEGIVFTNLYSTGTRTVRGIEAIVTGFLPTPGNSIVNLGLSRSGFFTAAEMLKTKGYATEFIYGGESNFDDMRSFFLGNGFDKVYDLPDFSNYNFKGVWGVSDEDLFIKANTIFQEHKGKPFFSVLLTTSNHSPFEFPEGKIILHDKPKNTVSNAMKYADYALGSFFKLAKESEYYKNTMFLIVADHSTRVFGDEFVPVKKFHVPAILFGPGIPVREISTVASQIDLLPTLLRFAGLATESPMIGQDLFSVDSNNPGRAMMQYGLNYGYLSGDTLTVLKPYMKPQEFHYDKYTNTMSLLPSVNENRAKDALAHSLLPWILYRNRQYILSKPINE